ncbi:hypothetical protein [Actinocrispum wychmicini]|uniref:HhH-GPD superfamily base excision DNA repair protein n=1 Tax=Actinocrispum wychmicini TaxID=1213861 RepID=A0A4R2JX98_9PSEU|nr:hypothetical protein [Actinocrispum wychmicini]TCO62018.1 hypothetical protein EV192_102155 [Actinocrispum wychmicini]
MAELRALQLSERKASYLIGVATALRDGRLRLPTRAGLDDQEVITELTRLHGIGRWTAEWFAVRVLGRPVVVAGDVALRRAVARQIVLETCA